MNQERSQPTQERRKVIEPVEYDLESHLNEGAKELVALLRHSLKREREIGVGLNLFINLDAPPYYTSEVSVLGGSLHHEYPIYVDLAYANQVGSKVKIHKEKVEINYDIGRVRRAREFVDTLLHRRIKWLDCTVSIDPREPQFIQIDPHFGHIVLRRVGINNWSEKE